MSIINNVLSKVIGSRNDRLIKKYSGQVAKINALEPQMQSMSDDELSSITARLKQRAKNNEKFILEIMKPISFNNDLTIENITLKLNQLLEKMIIRNPYQWIWSHNRWK